MVEYRQIKAEYHSGKGEDQIMTQAALGGTLWGLLMFVFAIVFVLLMIVAVSVVFQLIFSVAGIKILNKTGTNGMQFLIPVYGAYLFFKKTADSGILYWSFMVMIAFGALSFQLSYIFTIVFGILFLFFWFVFNINLATAFDQSVLFGIGLFLLPVVFYYILAFNGSRFSLNDVPTAADTAAQTA